MKEKKSVESLVASLKERAKELSCLYQIEELFSKPGATLESICNGIIEAIPNGWQYSDVCKSQIKIGESTFKSPGFSETAWGLASDLVVQDEVLGKISVHYSEERPLSDEGPFLKEERKLIDTIADRLERRILYEQLRTVFENKKSIKKDEQWRIILDLLKRTDPKLLTRLTRKMLNYLSWSGVSEADRILERFNPASSEDPEDLNKPSRVNILIDVISMSDDVFRVASENLGEKDILLHIQKWIKEDRSNFLVKVLEQPGSSVVEIANAIERFHHLTPSVSELSPPRERGITASLIRRLMSDQQEFIQVAKRFLKVDDFYTILHNIISPADSYGKLGGKGSGLLLASRILATNSLTDENLANIKTPKTWYITSDAILKFISHNDLEDIVEQKYEDITNVRIQYPYVVHVFKNSPLPPELVTALSVALDDFGEIPLVVRSSSLLEDRLGSAFAGKYKSLFVANQGSKRERLVALMDAITEVYASLFGPDPIEYRIERGILDFHEEMGVLIQEVVGTRVGNYYLPSFAGVAFSTNEFHWSRRLRSEDGLVRMVAGLGTRAVDRLSDDYPILVAPGQPSLRVNVTLEEQIRYSPKRIDVINLETNAFETIEMQDLLRSHGHEYPLVTQLVSVVDHDHLSQISGLVVDFEREQPIVTFNGLIEQTPIIQKIRSMLQALQAAFNTPVDIEFAHDGKNLYLLQCRPQSRTALTEPVAIPKDIPQSDLIFTAHKYVGNGAVNEITHIVYIDPAHYAELGSRAEMLAVGKAVGRLNQLLPKRRFILMGPGRWGSRGDIKLGVSVSYSDINNTAMLIEIARRKRDYVPELSFGTHFFQDLIEASIRYLPLYPDNDNEVFNEDFLLLSTNILSKFLPEYRHLTEVIRVIDVKAATAGKVASVLMNAELDEAVALLVPSEIF